ncbi:MAG: stage II sporulation protein D [Firmicutes bacterium]|nr:stage II sporulation protein D [Bacillota bacterium]
MRSNLVFSSLIILLILLSLLPLVVIKKMRDHSGDGAIPVTLVSGAEGKVYRFDLEEYLIGVVAAEMPASFELEALKAQAVAARTLAIRRMKRFSGQGCQHFEGADFCDDPAEHQAWLGEKSLKKRWPGWSYYGYYNKIKRAVRETSGIIMTYRDRPIDAVFHSTCGGETAAAKDVWNYEIPYLTRVKCDFDKHSPRYRNTFFFSWTELERRFQIPAASFKNMKKESMTPQGRVIALGIGGKRIKGSEFRDKLGLTSTCLNWETVSSGLSFTVVGYGHGVGLCQYGADGLAKKGWPFHRILKYYYRGITFSKIANPRRLKKRG